VAGCVVTAATHVVLLPAVHREMTLEQRLAAEVPTTVAALVAGTVEDEHVVPERSFALEHDRTALELLIGLVVHGGHVPFEIVLTVGEVAALWTAEQPLAAVRRRRRKTRGRSGKP